jgi:hypothetical protein
MALGWLWGRMGVACGWLLVAYRLPTKWLCCGLDVAWLWLWVALPWQPNTSKTRAFMSRFPVCAAEPGGWLIRRCAASGQRGQEASMPLARWACTVRDGGPKTETEMLLAQPSGSCQTPSWMSHQPDNISAGTQVVTLVEIRGPNRSLVHLHGEVGVVTRTSVGDAPKAKREINSVHDLSTTNHQIERGQRSDHSLLGRRAKTARAANSLFVQLRNLAARQCLGFGRL